MISLIVTPFLAALVLSLVLVPLVRLVSLRFGLVAPPREDRWHQRPVALFGGVAIAVSLFSCAIAFRIAWALPVVTFTAAVMFAAGLVDDVLALKPATKLIAQIALASALLFFDYRLNWLHSITLDSLLTLFWVVGLTNAFNLLDNMDGLCAGVAMIAGAALLVKLVPGGSPGALADARYLAVLLGATGGFLAYNVHPASIFMGDSGSMLLGFSFAAMTLGSGRDAQGRSDVLSIVAVPVLVLLIPIFDTTLVTLSRWFSGRRASRGGRDHSSHRLVAIGLSERRAVALLWLLAAVGGGLGLALEYSSQSWSALAVMAFLLGMVLFAAYLGGIRVYDDAVIPGVAGAKGDAGAKEGPGGSVSNDSLTPIVVEFLHRRRVAEVLLDFFLIATCYYAAYRLRFEDPEDFLRNFDTFSRSLPLILAVQLASFFVVGVYRGVWRHFGMADTLTVARGVFFGVASALIAILYAYRFFAYSRTVFVIYGVLLLTAVTLSRASFRLVGEFLQRQRQSGQRVVIYGAGDAGGLVVREVLSRGGDQRILGFIDDDPRKIGSRVSGYPVLGSYSALTVLVNAASIDTIVISARHMSPERLNNLHVLCLEGHVNLSRLTVGLEALVESDQDADADPPRAQIRQIHP
jgi:UDP-GlcNAc:undecaprenyl-phosphate GlcNAc-1-phosphate transferase